MPVRELNRLASVRPTPGLSTPDQTAMEQTPTRTAVPSAAPAASAAPGQQQAAPEQDEDAKIGKVGQLMTEMLDIAQEITQVDPRTTMIVKDTVKKLYLDLSKIYGVEDEVKLSMKKAQGGMQAQGLKAMGNL